MTEPYSQAALFVRTINPYDGIMDWRAIHDVRKDVPAIPFRGTLEECWSSIQYYQSRGYGIFATISALGGHGRELQNVWYNRAHVIDLDNLSAHQNANRAAASTPPPALMVESSPGKYHCYWIVTPYQGNERFTALQRRLRQFYDADKSVVDPTRVMRVPGTMHLKRPETPHLVHCWSLAGSAAPVAIEALESAYAAVNVIDSGSGIRKPLGDPDLAAPSLAWIERALELTDPNTLTRGEWVSMFAAVKQAGWSLTDEITLRSIFDKWCARYDHDNPAENNKQWNSIRNTEVGWPALKRRVPAVAMEQAGIYAPTAPVAPSDATIGQTPLQPPPLDCNSEILTHLEQAMWFKDCIYVTSLNAIMMPDATFLKSSEFNTVKGGRLFLITSQGKTVNEAWQAATRGTQFKVPIVDHIRFIPTEPFGSVHKDALGREGINMYKPAIIERMSGDPSPFLRHIGFMLPDTGDQKILLDYLAHNIKYPGFKIPWAPVIQSVEGGGKGIIKNMMRYCIGDIYNYAPNAKELADSGSRFNAWMRAKLFILADEIKVDDRRDMIEVLKPMITEEEIEVQAKGYDQRVEDNFANWLFFTNYKDAVPINSNSRRFCIFYSAFQSKKQLLQWGLGDKYFTELYDWMNADGAAIMYDYFMNYPIKCGDIHMRAPDTSSTPEVLLKSMGPVEKIVVDGVNDNSPGFRNDWVSITMVRRIMADRGLHRLTTLTVEKIIESMGYHLIGRSRSVIVQEDARERSTLFNKDPNANIDFYMNEQGYVQ